MAEPIDLITRIYPFAVHGEIMLCRLHGTTRTAPPGYTLNIEEGYVECNALTEKVGLITRYLEWQFDKPIPPNCADLIFDAALEHLEGIQKVVGA